MPEREITGRIHKVDGSETEYAFIYETYALEAGTWNLDLFCIYDNADNHFCETDYEYGLPSLTVVTAEEKERTCFYLGKRNEEWVWNKRAEDREGCRLLDSCHVGGGKRSGGGCYKYTEAAEDKFHGWEE